MWAVLYIVCMHSLYVWNMAYLYDTIAFIMFIWLTHKIAVMSYVYYEYLSFLVVVRLYVYTYLLTTFKFIILTVPTSVVSC